MANESSDAALKPATNGFKRDQLQNVVKVEVRLPLLHPSTIETPFTFYMRLQLVKEAEEAQTRFLALSDDEMALATHEYDANMLSLLSLKAPTGFDDFPQVDNDPQALRKAIYDYLLFEDGTVEQREALAHICRTTVRRYNRTVNPSDYL
jgi:hypothetical protein